MGETSRSGQGNLLLVVEDHSTLRSLLQEWLSRALTGWRCATAENGEQALRLVATERPRAVLLDIGLPDINGIEVLKRIKRSAPEVMVIMLSSNAAEVHRIEAEVHGANGYVDKERMYTDLIPLLVALL